MPVYRKVYFSMAKLMMLFLMGTVSAHAQQGIIRGNVSSDNGAEAGVWVIVETTDLGRSYRKIVVTDEEGRFLVPELPSANYSIWVRGYGLLDTRKLPAKLGDNFKLQAKIAPTAQDAAKIYPANYWLSLLEVPAVSEFPGTGHKGNGIAKGMRNQANWIDRLKDGCQLCHQMGTEATRKISYPEGFDSTQHAWDMRLRLGGNFTMIGPSTVFGRDRVIDTLVDWSDRIAAGELPEAPPRPKGIERNLVITQWGWSNDTAFVHDNVSTDKRNPYLYPDGQIFGANMTQGKIVITDVIKNISREFDVPMRENMNEAGASYGGRVNPANVHNPMMDGKNRVWQTSTIRSRKNPDWCTGSDHPSAKRFPLVSSDRHLSYFDVESEKFTLIDTCFATHHLQFMADENDTLWLSGDLNVIGWIDTKKYDETQDEQASQGWCPTILDTNGDGKVGEYVEPTEAVDPTKDKRISGFSYGIITNPLDGSVWFARPYPDMVPGEILRLDPKTCITEVYQPPFDVENVPVSKWGFGPRGVDIDTNGVIWAALAGSGHLASFDRRKCKVLNGPTATGQHCPEGWTLHDTPGPQMKGVEYSGSADFHYLIWVDQFDTLGLGKDIPITTGTTSDSLIALMPETDEMVILRVPYPLGFYTRGMDGRIDNGATGWKGRGLWASNNSSVIWHTEGGMGMTSDIMKFQIRPHPLAK